MSDLLPLPLPEFECYYDGHEWWAKGTDGEFSTRKIEYLRHRLSDLGYRAWKTQTEAYSPADQYLDNRADSHHIHYAGALAGHNAGFYQMCGKKVLVTSSPQLITPVKGEFPLIQAVVCNMLDWGGFKQSCVYFGWLQVWLRALYGRSLMPGQVLALVGPVECGKSLLQKIATRCTGNRQSNPYEFMTGQTTFNADLHEAEHLVIEDCASKLTHPERVAFGQRIKNIAVNEAHWCHGKGSKALMLTPLWRLSISLNDAIENLMVLPPMDMGLLDKLHILLCVRRDMPMPTNSHSARAAFNAAWEAELPAFIYYLLNEFELPATLQTGDVRCGMTGFQHPDVMEQLGIVSTEMQLLELIDRARHGEFPWTATASEIESFLYTDKALEHQAKRVLHFNNATGTLLGRLRNVVPERVKYAPNYSRNRKWIILPAPSSTHFQDGAAETPTGYQRFKPYSAPPAP